MSGECAVDGCERAAHTRGWCRKHYLRWLTHGDPTHLVDTRKTECKRGHPFTPENTWVDRNGHKNCIECRRERKRQWRAARRLPHWADLLEPIDGVIEIPLRRGDGVVALVDADDLGLVRDFSWHLHDNGYASADARLPDGRRRLYMHRLILQLTLDGLEVDHINRDRLDNRRSNLRAATRTQQARNTSLRSNNTSGYKGVSRAKGARWQAHIRIDGRSISLGSGFITARAAAAAYDKAATEAFGEFAAINFPPREAA